MPSRVMLVEDESVVAVGLRAMLQDCGYDVVSVARSGEDAVREAAELHPDVAVVDVKLPGIDGIETTRQLVANGDTAVIILTAYTNREFVEGAVAAGAFAYLLKPVGKESLCANVEMALARCAELGNLRREVDDARSALEVRKLAERAKHVIMERLSLPESEAFAYLRQKCRNQNKTMREAAEEILSADEAFLKAVSNEPPEKRAKA